RRARPGGGETGRSSLVLRQDCLGGASGDNNKADRIEPKERGANPADERGVHGFLSAEVFWGDRPAAGPPANRAQPQLTEPRGTDVRAPEEGEGRLRVGRRCPGRPLPQTAGTGRPPAFQANVRRTPADHVP